MVRNDITRKIGEDLDNFRAHAFANEAAAMTRRSVISAPARRCPRGASTNAELAQSGRHHRRVDRRAHRHPQPLHRRRRRDHRDPRHRRARKALEHAGVAATDIDLIVLATATPDQTFPVVGDQGPGRARHRRLHRLRRPRGVHRLPLRAVVADSMLKGGMARKALVIGSETFSRILDWEDRATCVLFGDGAGALVLSAEEGEAASSRPGSTPTAATTTCCSSTAGPRPPARSASCG
jgi:3-oxoacyl-[acyl-carrier-protein] synthase-3